MVIVYTTIMVAWLEFYQKNYFLLSVSYLALVGKVTNRDLAGVRTVYLSCISDVMALHGLYSVAAGD